MPKVAKLVSNWMLAEVLKHLNMHHQDISDVKFTPENFADFIQLVYLGKVNSSAAQTILNEMYANGGDPGQIMENMDLAQMSDAGMLETVIDAVIAANPVPVADFKAGKEKALQFLIGQVMKETKGKANPGMLGEIFKKKLQ
jgi:aspartyl-tRNA(Asn)/glutamyl-tRNA(Gln) amidotransferase subunit B